VLVQTYAPDHPAIQAAVRHDYHKFVASELPEREKYGVPPFGRLVRLIARGPEESAVFAYLQQMAEALRAAAEPTVRILGPAPAPILKIRNLYRFHIQIRCPSPRPLQLLARTVPHTVPAPHGIELAIDVDPIHML
jgi:primosomal protein N' (replication factor Y)